MDIRIDNLDAATSAQSDHAIPAMRNDVTVQLTVEQIATFIVALVTDSAPETLDTLNELAAALGDDPNFATTVTNSLAGKQPLDAMLTAISGLTSANGKFLAFSGSDTPTVRDIVGTVSETGGVPTAAIIEKGSGANGGYTRWADGTQICWHTITIDTVTPGTWATSVWTYPVPFLSAPSIQSTVGDPVSNQIIVAGFSSVTASDAGITLNSASSAVPSQPVSVSAVGRWF